MEPKIQEIVREINDLTTMKKLKWEFVGGQAQLQSQFGEFIVRLTNSGVNVAFHLMDTSTGKAIISYAERRNQPGTMLYSIWKTAQRQTLGTDEKLDQALEQLKKLKE